MTIQALGDYTLLKKIGSGGFGTVYLAEHRFMKKKAVLKVLSKKLSSDRAFIERFEKHVGVLATLDHPSIVKVHNISHAEDHYFLVTDACIDKQGDIVNLSQYVRKKGKALSERHIETILRQVASALDYAHSIGFGEEYLTHRGLKLTNILIDDNEKGLRVYITDFGLAKLVGEGFLLSQMYQDMLERLATDATDSSEVPFFHHTAFLSPEQKEGNQKIDIKSDVYSFGILAYYLLTKKVPRGYFEMPSSMVPYLKLNWDLLIAKCLQPDPENRPYMLMDAMNQCLSKDRVDSDSFDVLSWGEVEKKVENAMQMSFEFSFDEKHAPSGEPTSPKPKLSKEEQTPLIKPSKIERPQYEPDPGAIFQKELNVSVYQPKKEEVRDVEPLMTEMGIVRGGTFFRGSNEGARDESPRHSITISDFALDIHPVTNEQFARFLEVMGGQKDVNNNDLIRLKDSRLKRNAGKISIESGYAKHPVVGVTWYGATAYAKWIGKRLPTEAEWEIAAIGGGEDAIYPFGKDIDRTLANFFNTDTTAVMSYPPNGYGFFDMAGNVYEWCQDWYAYNYYDISTQEPENPKGPLQGVYRVLRGGCWKSLKEDLRCSHRHRNNPGAVNSTYGFRCATDVT